MALEAQANLLEHIGDNLEHITGTRTIYGVPIERDDVTIVPIGKARYGFGGGGGRQASQEGGGAGGGAVITPIGYIEIRKGQSRFKHIYDLASVAQLVLALGVSTLLVARAVRPRTKLTPRPSLAEAA